ncbi:hypothetical protein, partial [Neisseria sicca]|uniref:hypothetical protein n=1 Tax=Neisseria sicca TaxID=490 RepID=UPI003608A619
MFRIVTDLPVFAKTFTYTVQCNIQVIDPKKAPNPPARITGTGTGAACTAAKKDATQKAPAGTYARHCLLVRPMR